MENFEPRREFLKLWNPLANSSGEGLYELIETLYSDPHRTYHNLSHIHDCLNKAGTLPLKDEERTEVLLAIWFHDVVYDVRAKDNEERSADFFVNAAREADLPVPLTERVREMILATKGHTVQENSPRSLKIFLDIDLSILGSSPEKFERYDRAIRSEYSWVPGWIYYLKRAGILRSFLARPNLYFTAEMRTLFEVAARENVSRVLQRRPWLSFLKEIFSGKRL